MSSPGSGGSIQRRWAVENEAHHTIDTVFAEDEHPWIEGHAQGALNVLVLRRIALTILALYRSVHLRANGRRDCPRRPAPAADRSNLLARPARERILW